MITRNKAVELEIEYFYNLETEEDSRSTVFLSGSTKPTYKDAKPVYEFYKIPHSKASSKTGGSTGVISLRHFCNVMVGIDKTSSGK